ncbi:unnamed protein product [Adineta steineri]|uniref:Uncharacterized protein n=1 Tax=Adineta steineri TaxID=433720 RepID=A0A814PB11_9BILA|nr:unnamed protein product [Adineta steineri]CAF3781235.1 unnamed protein product [Adineta steineri]
MYVYSRSFRWLQIILTLFYGQVISTGIYEYLIQGISGLTLQLRPVYDSILLIIFGILMFAFVPYAIFALWYCRTRMSIITLLISIAILILTLVKSIIEISNMGQYPIRKEWIFIRIMELILRLFGIIALIIFIIRLRQEYRPDNF